MLALWGCGGGEDGAPPNLVLVVVDTLRADHLTEYGYGRETSGAMSRFLAEATRFENAYAPAPWTRPSVATLFSGLLPSRHRARLRETNLLNPAIRSPAEILAAAGYRTGGFSGNIYVSRATRFDQGFDEFVDHTGRVNAYPDVGSMVSWAKGWLAGSGSPFFLYLQPMNVHGPYRVPPYRRDVLLGRAPSRDFGYMQVPMLPIVEGRLEYRELVDEAYLESLTDQYDTAIRYTLDAVSEIFHLLLEEGEWDRSLVIVTADHGEELFDHGGFSHGYSLHRELLEVPLFVKFPGQKGAEVRHDRVSLADVYPTLLETLAVGEARRLDGRSLAAPPAGERELVFEVNSDEKCDARAILSGRYKLIHTRTDYQRQGETLELFDVESDPGELIDLAVEAPEVVARLRQRMEEIFAELERRALPLPDEENAELDEGVLRALGYVN